MLLLSPIFKQVFFFRSIENSFAPFNIYVDVLLFYLVVCEMIIERLLETNIDEKYFILLLPFFTTIIIHL